MKFVVQTQLRRSLNTHQRLHALCHLLLLTKPLRVQYTPTASALQFSSVNLVTQAKPCFHVARYLPTIRDCQAPFTLAWQVSLCLHFCRSSPICS